MSSQTFFFYDLETSGLDPKTARIMQFAGQRTDLDLNPVGEPVNIMIKMTPDTLPEIGAIMVTGITPQQTLQDGVTEHEFLTEFYEHICVKDTVFVGFNTVRFDDEFMRYLLYRNFYDAYEWQWDNGCSKWDILDVVRMTRALRPDGIVWPVTPEGKPTNRLELLTKLNNLDHFKAHDALSDVYATIAVAKLIKDKQPDLFKYLYEHRGKKDVKPVVDGGQPFVYASGKYPGEFNHTTAAVLLGPHPGQEAALVYDLRHDPSQFLHKTAAELVEHWRFSRDPEHVKLPVKTLKYNRCPAVAPLGVLDAAAQERLQLPLETIKQHLALLRKNQDEFCSKIAEAIKLLDEERTKAQTGLFGNDLDVDGRLYDGFFGPNAKNEMRMVRAARPTELSDIELKSDERLQQLLPLYKARNYPTELTTEERQAWDAYCQHKLQTGGTTSRLAKFAKSLQETAESKGLTDEKRYILEELQLYAESIVQLDTADEQEIDYAAS
jgi:exodeoxyribonuclease-1